MQRVARMPYARCDSGGSEADVSEDKQVWVHPDATAIVLRIRQTYVPVADPADTHPVIGPIDSGGRHTSAPSFTVPAPGQDFFQPALQTVHRRKQAQCQICYAEPVATSLAHMDHPAYRYLGEHCRAHLTGHATPLANFLRFSLRSVLDAVMARYRFEDTAQ